MLTIKSAISPKYITVDNSTIELQVMFEEFGDSILPFAAMANDVEEHGRELYARAIAGEFGEISPYVPPGASANAANNQPATTGSQDL
jgi:hypothetical protein